MTPDAMMTNATPAHETPPCATPPGTTTRDATPHDAIQPHTRHQMIQQTTQLEATKIYVAVSTY
jgi:hypothetical protein